MNKKNILITISSFYGGGAEKFSIDLANRLSKETGFNIYFLELYSEKTVRKYGLRDLNQKITIIKPSINIFFQLISNTVKIFKYENENFIERLKAIIILFHILIYRIKIIHSNSWPTDYFFSRYDFLKKYILVSTMHGHYELQNDRGNKKFTNNWLNTLKNIDKIIYISEKQKKFFQSYGIDTTSFKKIYNGIEFNDEPIVIKKKESIFKIVMVGRGIELKGWELAIESIRRLIKKYNLQIEFHMLGESKYLDNLYHKYSQEGFLVYHGYKKEVVDMVKKMDLAILPTIFPGENLPYTIMEYLSVYKPIITNDIGEIKEMLASGDGVAGTVLKLDCNILCSEGNIEKLSEAIFEYYQNEELRNKHSNLAKKAFSKFDLKNTINQYKSLYEELH